MPTVAVIEDDALVREGTVSFLELMGFLVVAAATSSALITELVTSGVRPAVLLCDFRLDAQTALEAVPQVMNAIGRDVPVLIATGDSSAAVKEQISGYGWRRLLKPYTPHELLLQLEELVQSDAA